MTGPAICRSRLETLHQIRRQIAFLGLNGDLLGFDKIEYALEDVRTHQDFPFSNRAAVARGPYGGCVGYFSFSGNLDCCITIRTALLKGGQAYVQAGGGWVNDSTPESEFQETVNKAKAMLKAVSMAENFTNHP